ncbi:hypothetical protein DLREEDagrD3_18160 [Denitratisoma sp. agr-D3]
MQSPSPTPNEETPLPSPMAAWTSGFNYAFGFQIKLMLSFLGLDSDKNK